MSLRSLVLALVLVALVIFAAVNWSAFTSPTTLSLVVTTVQAPLGLIMLVISGLLAALFLAYIVYLQTTVILEARRYARELATQRELADQAEASRFTELRSFVDERLQKIQADAAATRTAMQAELGQMQERLRSTVEQSGNTLAAYIGRLRTGWNDEWRAGGDDEALGDAKLGKPFAAIMEDTIYRNSRA